MDEIVEINGDIVTGTGLSEAEDSIVQHFLNANRVETRNLADIIMEKIKEKEMNGLDASDDPDVPVSTIPPKVIEVYTAVGKLLQHYTSGKLPKALKMLPHLKNCL